MPQIKIRNCNHYYEWITASGEPEPSGKPVMVFIHGWGGSSRYWESTARALSNQFDCLLYDMRGFGRSRFLEAVAPQSSPESDPSTPNSAVATSILTETQVAENVTTAAMAYEMENYAEDLAELLDALQLQRVYLNAHSMGASVAVFFLNLFADRVEKAILTCSGIFEYDERSFSAFHKFGGYVVKFRPRWLYGLPLMDRFFMARFLHRSLPSTISRAFLDDFLMADYQAALNTIFTSVSQKAAEVMPQEFARLKVPTLLVAGEHDIIIPAELGRKAADLSDRVEYVLIPDTAHFPMLEDSETYLDRVWQFLGTSPG